MTVGTDHIAGRYAVGTAPEFRASASTHILGIVRTRTRFMPTARIGRLILSLGRIQPKHVQQNGGHIRHHNERYEHNKPRQNGKAADAQLIQQNGENNHDNDFQEGAVLLSSK
jgi:hypothetical protein